MHLPSERSACLTDTECQVRWRPDEECQGICLLNAECQGRCRPDEECQGICLLNAAHVLQTQNVKADGVRTRSVRAFAF